MSKHAKRKAARTQRRLVSGIPGKKKAILHLPVPVAEVEVHVPKEPERILVVVQGKTWWASFLDLVQGKP